MASMNTRTADLCEAIEHLPDGSTLVIHDLQWDDYEELLEDLRSRPRLRVSYDCGRLEVMSPLQEHEAYGRFIDRMVYFYCDEFDLKVETYGGATWKRRSLKKGVEPDACYYVENAARVIGKRKFDLEIDPVPDIVVEIDITNESLGKFPIYAALGVPEIWRYDAKAFQFYELTGNGFVETAGSRFLPGLTGRIMAETLEASKTLGQTEALKTFRNRIRDYSGT
jgi:Uma2 family endonuclease